MPEAESGIITLYGNSPRMKIVDFFMQFPKSEFTVSDLVEGIGMSRTTVFKEIAQLLDNDMIVISGNAGKSNTYKINLKSPIVYSMQKLVSHRSKKIATSQLQKRTQDLMHLTKMQAEDLFRRELMLKAELKLVRTTIREQAPMTA